MVKILHQATDGSGFTRTISVAADVWHKTHLNGSNGKQPLWYYCTTDSWGEPLAQAKIYEDRNPYRKLRGGLRLYRWDVFPAGVGYSYARGESVSLTGAKIAAEACADLVVAIKPYNEKVHKR
jgi:hypothetical protein